MSDIKFLDALSSSFELLPGVGKKTANRYAYNVIEKMSEEEVKQFAENLIKTKNEVKHCIVCGMLSLKETCEICNSKMRDDAKIMVLKDTKDIIAIEKMGEYNGLYHSLNGLISPLEGVGPDDINIESLENRLGEKVKEVIIATSFTPAGETTAMYLEKILAREGLCISRLGYGIPAGGDIEYIDSLTLKRALMNRTKK